MSTVNIKINGTPIEVSEGTSVLHAARQAGYKIPTLCYHEDLAPFGSCGLCIVKQEGSSKIIRACARRARAWIPCRIEAVGSMRWRSDWT